MDGQVSDSFIAAGYFRHDRGKWRKRQSIYAAEQTCHETELPALLAAGNQAKVGAEAPYIAELATRAESAWIELMAAGDFDMEVTLREELDNLLERYGSPSDTALPRLLVRNLAMCHLQVAFADLTYAQCREASLTQAKFLLERQRHAHQRMLHTAKTLAEVRKLVEKKRLKRPRN